MFIDYLFGVPYSEKAKDSYRKAVSELHDGDYRHAMSFMAEINDRIINKSVGLLTIIAILSAVSPQLYVSNGDRVYLGFLALNILNFLLTLPTLKSGWPPAEIISSPQKWTLHGLEWATKNARLLNVNIVFLAIIIGSFFIYIIISKLY